MSARLSSPKGALGKNPLPSSFILLAEFNSVQSQDKKIVSLTASSKKHSQHLETAHISFHMVLSIFKPARCIKSFSVLESQTSSISDLQNRFEGLLWSGLIMGVNSIPSQSQRFYRVCTQRVGILGVILEFCLPHISDVKVLYTLPLLLNGKMKSKISISKQICNGYIF